MRRQRALLVFYLPFRHFYTNIFLFVVPGYMKPCGGEGSQTQASHLIQTRSGRSSTALDLSSHTSTVELACASRLSAEC